MGCLRLAPLTSELEQKYWRMVKHDYCDYYFFIYDLLLQREKTKVVLALEQGAIAGIMLIFEGCIVQLRGKPVAIHMLLDDLNLPHADVQVPKECEQLLLEKYPSPQLKAEITLMTLKKGEQRLAESAKPQPLEPRDAQEIALLMNKSYPEMWGEVSSEQVSNRFTDNARWLGIKAQGHLVSFGYATLTPQVSHVTWIATDPQWRNRGYASYIVSALVKECLHVAPTAIIYVTDDNATAKDIYTRVGFKPYKRYVFAKT